MRYSYFANVSVNHEYYRGRCSCFCFVPSVSAKKEMSRQKLILRETNGCLKIFAPEDLDSGVNALYFGVYSNNFDLWNVTILNHSENEVPVFIVKENHVSLVNESLDDLKKDLDIPNLMFFVKLCSNGSENSFESLKIPLETRKCRWRYNINGDFSQYDVKIHSLNGLPNDSFDVEKKSEDLMIFTSKDCLPVVYGDVPKFQLRTKDTSRILMKSLPNMDSRSLSRIESKGGGYEIVAESFINL